MSFARTRRSVRKKRLAIRDEERYNAMMTASKGDVKITKMAPGPRN